MLVQKLGLKTASRKKGSSGTQVKYYSLAVEEIVFATQLLQYRQEQRIKREERKRQRQLENRLYQIMLETQYGITDNSISPPPKNSNFTELEQGVNMPKTQSQSALEKILPLIDLLETVESGLEMLFGLVERISCPNWIWRLLIDWLKHSRKSFPLDLKET